MHEGHDHGARGHAHDHGAAATREEVEALLRFTLSHNRSHEEELHNLAHSLEQLGLKAAANEVWCSLDDARCGTEHVERAIAALAK